jgi:NAD(P)-dependent dehydrogenase (short-subunit alcohol dehydrogenase family)
METAMQDLSGTPVTIIGASRGLGRVLAENFHRRGAQMLVVARGQAGLDAVTRALPGIKVLACDASAPDAPGRVFAVQVPRILILCGGAMPPCRPFLKVDWKEFSDNWNNDVRMSFHFLQAALKRPLAPGATIITITSGAVRQGSPISGGYAGAKQMQIFMTGYAQKEADRAGINLRFLSLAPARLMPQTDIGAAASRVMPPTTAPARPLSLMQWGRDKHHNKSPVRCST